jgi:hypothetical protein
MPPDEARGRIHVDDAAMIDDGHAIAEALGLLHQMRREKHGLAARANAADKIPDGAARLRVEAGRQLIEKHQLGSLISASAMNSRCFCRPTAS